MLLASVACWSDGPTEARVPAGAIDGPWRPVPFALPGPIIEAVDRTCRGSFDEFPQQAQLMVIDARGAGRVEAQYAGPNGEEASCAGMTIDATGRIERGGGATGFGGQEWRVLQAFELEAYGRYGSDEASSTVGRAGSRIAKVVIVVPGQPPVTGSLANGWYLAWWPDSWPPGTKVFGIDSLGQTVTEAPIE
jgi:hypothetical protein